MSHFIERRSGARNGMARLSFKQAERIRQLYKNGESQSSLMRKYGVSHVTIWKIVHNRTYTEPETPEVAARKHRKTKNRR